MIAKPLFEALVHRISPANLLLVALSEMSRELNMSAAVDTRELSSGSVSLTVEAGVLMMLTELRSSSATGTRSLDSSPAASSLCIGDEIKTDTTRQPCVTKTKSKKHAMQ